MIYIYLTHTNQHSCKKLGGDRGDMLQRFAVGYSTQQSGGFRSGSAQKISGSSLAVLTRAFQRIPWTSSDLSLNQPHGFISHIVQLWLSYILYITVLYAKSTPILVEWTLNPLVKRSKRYLGPRYIPFKTPWEMELDSWNQPHTMVNGLVILFIFVWWEFSNQVASCRTPKQTGWLPTLPTQFWRDKISIKTDRDSNLPWFYRIVSPRGPRLKSFCS